MTMMMKPPANGRHYTGDEIEALLREARAQGQAGRELREAERADERDGAVKQVQRVAHEAREALAELGGRDLPTAVRARLVDALSAVAGLAAVAEGLSEGLLVAAEERAA